MERYRPIHPERPALRAAAAVGASLALHAAAVFALLLWAAAIQLAERRAEAARPKEVALARLDAHAWERNRAVEPERSVQGKVPDEPAESRMARALSKPAPPAGGTASAAAKAPPPALPGVARAPAGEDGGAAKAGTAVVPGRPAIDLQPRPLGERPLAMRFDAVGEGPPPITEGTAFSGFTVQDPDAWRFSNFFNRAVESMNSVYRYELGAPLPPSLYAKWTSDPRQAGACSYTWVSLDAHGALVEAQVRKSSGMADLDALIVEVIRRTAPFANFPAGLLDASGVYRDTWGLCIIRGGRRG